MSEKELIFMRQLTQFLKRLRGVGPRNSGRRRRYEAEPLEIRTLLASVMDAGTTLRIELEANEGIQVASNGTSYDFTSTNSVFSDNGIADTVDFSVFDAANLTLNDLAQYTNIEVTDGGDGAFVEFINSGSGQFHHHLDIVFDELAAARSVDFSGVADFGDNNLTINSTGAVHMRPGTDLQVRDGNISIVASNQTDGSELRNGIETFGATVTTSGTGDIHLTGTGATSNQQLNRLDGIVLRGSTIIQSTSNAADAGTIQLNGNGGGGTAFEYGVLIQDTTIRSVNGDIALTGTGGTGTEHSHYGIAMQRVTFESTGVGPDAADISFSGTGGTAEDFGVGFIVTDGTLTTVDGDIEITGVGGSGMGGNNFGFRLTNTVLESTGTGSEAGRIVIDATGGTGTHAGAGGAIQDDSKILTVDGEISINADAGPSATEHGNGGLWVQAVIRSVGDGPINIAGAAGSGSHFSRGVEVVGDVSRVESVSSSITITGIGGNTVSGGGDGVDIRLGAVVTSASGNILISGTGGTGEAGSSQGVRLLSGAQVRSTGVGADGGAITIEGNGGAGEDRNIGLEFNGVTVEAVSGDISLIGRAGHGTTDSNRGINMSGSTVRSTGTGASAGDISLTGFGGSGTDWNVPVMLTSNSEDEGVISSVDGAITVTGSPNGTVSGHSNHGVWVALPVTATGTGGIRIDGAGNAGSSFNRGVLFSNTNVETTSGDLAMNGVGGNGTEDFNEGVVVDDQSVLVTTAGSILVHGTSGANDSHGVELWGTEERGAAIISWSDGGPGTIEIRATGNGTGDKDDFRMYQKSSIGGPASGDINIFADTVEFDENTRLSGIGHLTIAPFSNGAADQSITLGWADTDSRTDLNLTMQEIGILDPGFETVTFGSPEAIDNRNFVRLGNFSSHGDVRIIGGIIQDTPGFDLFTRHSELQGRVEVGNPIGVLNLRDATLASTSELAIQVDGETPGEGAGHHDQVNSDGVFNINAGATLSVALIPGWRPEGGEEIIIVDRTGGSGTFHNLSEGSILVDFFGASITYAGGDGDDIVLRIPETILSQFPARNWAKLGEIGPAGTTVLGADFEGRLGQAVNAAGDVNGDGIDDYLIGANRANTSGNGRAEAGEAYLIYGSTNPAATIDVADLGDRGVVFLGAGPNNLTGHFVDTGDFNNDGFNDIVIGAHGYEGKGGAFVVWGAADLPQTIDLATLGSAGITISGADDGDLTGNPVSALGDINNDGFDDFALGAIYADGIDNEILSAGEAIVFFGGADLPTTIDLSQQLPNAVRIFGSDLGDEAGVSVFPLGDVNGDGVDDLVVGARYADGAFNADVRAGESYILFGREDWSDMDLHSQSDVVIYGADTRDFSGHPVRGGGDVNGDGFNDLVIGAHGGDSLNNQRTNAGEAHLIFGGPEMPAEIRINDLGDNGVSFWGGTDHDHAGRSVDIVGDLNADGYDDIAIGAYLADGRPLNDKAANSGAVYVIQGGPTLPNSVELGSLTEVAFTLYGSDISDNAGIMVRGAGDVNQDGFDDLLVGARLADSFNNSIADAGEAYVIYGNKLIEPAVPIVTGPTGVLDGDDATVTWDAAAGAESYELWLERIGDDKNPVVNPTSVDGTSYDVGNLVFGRYSAWVRANRGDGSKSSWRANTFSVTASTTIQSAGEVDGRLDVSWDAVPGATGYRVYVSNVTQRQNPVVDTVVTETSFRSNLPLTFGLHRVWVQPIGPGTAVGSWSRHADYNFAPQPISPQSTLSNRPTFEWTSVDGVESVQLYIQTWPNVVVNQSGITGTSYTPDFDLDAGFYRWWVRATAENGRTAGWSDTGIVSIGSTQITGPATDVVDGFAEIEWQTLDGAGTDQISYHVYLYSDTEQRLIRRQADITDTAFRSEALADGDYRVWVQPRLVNSRVFRWSRPYSFRVETPSSVEVQLAEPTTPTFDASPTFRWTAPAQVRSFNLFLTDGETVIYETGLTAPEWTPSSNLAPGPWKWRVQGVDALGQVGSWSAEATTDTSARAVVTAVDISGTQATVRWSAVLGADRYVLQIDVRRGEQGVVREDDLTATSFTTTLVPNELYRVWVRAIAADGSLGTWSYQFEFETR